jgi:hypothetical protein
LGEDAYVLVCKVLHNVAVSKEASFTSSGAQVPYDKMSCLFIDLEELVLYPVILLEFGGNLGSHKIILLYSGL